MCRCCRRGRRTRPSRTSAHARLAWPERERGGAARGGCALRDWTHASGTRHLATRRGGCGWTRARTACPPGNHPTTPWRCCSWLWLGKCTGHPHPTPGWSPGWVKGGRSARRRCLGGRTLRGQRSGPTLPTLAVARADGHLRAALVSRGQAGTPSLLPEWDACTTALCQHCPAHAHCHVCCPSARRHARRHAAAPLGSGVAPAARSRALAKGATAPLCATLGKGSRTLR